jgi:hypothetical protein
MDETAPRRWILVARECGVPGELGGASQWSLDHLFLDQDGVPTLVEVKRSTDTRIRREVVGQMLDYAANAVVYWPVDFIREKLEETCDADRSSVQLLSDLLGTIPDDTDSIERFWQQVRTNLQAGRIRMVFVADEIPPELKRIVEFLNGQMSPAEVLAVEIKQYVGKELKTLVPRVIGRTAEAEQKTGQRRRETKIWDAASFFEYMDSNCGPEQTKVARQIHQWISDRGLLVRWGRGDSTGSFYATLEVDGIRYNPFGIRIVKQAYVELNLGGLLRTPGPPSKPPLLNEAKREELRTRLNRIPGVNIPYTSIDKFPSIHLTKLSSDPALKSFFETFDWLIDLIRKREQS